MNKQELIERIEGLKNLFGAKVEYIEIDAVIELISKLDEPQKVTIPQFVADWIEYCKAKKITLAHALYRSEEEKNKNVYCWIVQSLGHQETFALAWIFGYEVEKTKYVVTDGNHLYFKGYQEDVDIVILADEQPGTMDYVKKFNTKEEAQKAADILGWKVQEVE